MKRLTVHLFYDKMNTSLFGGVFLGNVLKIGELARIAGVSKRTIDYYTKIGLLEAQRSQSNYRYYSEECLEILKIIDRLKKENMPLAEIKERLNLLKEHSIPVEQAVEKIEYITDKMKWLEEELLKLKPLLEKMNEKQVKAVSKSLTNCSASLIQSLIIVLGENPLI